MIEALACGSAVLASDIPALREAGGPAATYCPVADVPAWCMGTGNEFISREEFGDQMKFLVRKTH